MRREVEEERKAEGGGRREERQLTLQQRIQTGT